MYVFRIAKKEYAYDLSGEGARMHGGRWNHALTPCLYCSESRALAMLEYSVNVAASMVPATLIILTLEVPDDEIMLLRRDVLPTDWAAIPAGENTKNMGTIILNDSDVGIIGVPSAIVPEERNYLLNPLRFKANWPRVIEAKEIGFDFRIKQ